MEWRFPTKGEIGGILSLITALGAGLGWNQSAGQGELDVAGKFREQDRADSCELREYRHDCLIHDEQDDCMTLEGLIRAVQPAAVSAAAAEQP